MSVRLAGMDAREIRAGCFCVRSAAGGAARTFSPRRPATATRTPRDVGRAAPPAERSTSATRDWKGLLATDARKINAASKTPTAQGGGGSHGGRQRGGGRPRKNEGGRGGPRRDRSQRAPARGAAGGGDPASPP